MHLISKNERSTTFTTISQRLVSVTLEHSPTVGPICSKNQSSTSKIILNEVSDQGKQVRATILIKYEKGKLRTPADNHLDLRPKYDDGWESRWTLQRMIFIVYQMTCLLYIFQKAGLNLIFFRRNERQKLRH
jgi:hypothetical protein